MSRRPTDELAARSEAFNALPVPAVVIDSAGVIIAQNAATFEERGDVVDRPLEAFAPEARTRAGVYQCLDGVHELRVSPPYGLDSNRVALRLISSERILPASLLHDLRNLLTIILQNVELASASGDCEYSEGVIAAVEQASRLLRTYGNPSPRSLEFVHTRANPPSTAIDLNQVLRTSSSVLHAAVLQISSARLVVETAPEPAPICAPRETVERLLLNLVLNAAEACSQAGGTIWLQVYHADTVHLRISDNGWGMPARIRDRVLEASTTTNPGPERGQGLSGLRELVRGEMVQVSLVSKPGSGTTFDISFRGPEDTADDSDDYVEIQISNSDESDDDYWSGENSSITLV